MRLKGLKNCNKIYFIGVCGISMSALAKFLSAQGYEISGSDAIKGEETESLAFHGIRFFVGVDSDRKELLDADAIVYTDAISPTHPELQKAREIGKKMLTRAELLGVISKGFKNVISVAGSHGKTTCTAMCAHVLRYVDVPFCAHIGGEDLELGNYYFSGDEYFITEACEYKKNLLKLSPDVGILLNIDKDHMECYNSEDDLRSVFQEYCKVAKTAFVCADDEKCRDIGDFPSFGIEYPFADYRAVDLRSYDERYAFTVEEYGKPLCRIKLNAIGRCNVYNSIATFSALRSFGFHEKEIAKGLESFHAVKRRFERIGSYHGASFICDYAHHPREIMAARMTAEGICKGNLYVVFQPHTYSRTKLLMREFIEALQPIKNLMLYKTYPAREKFDREGSAFTLSHAVGNCLYAENVYVLKTWIKKTIREGDTVLFLGAGDIYFVAKYLLRELC